MLFKKLFGLKKPIIVIDGEYGSGVTEIARALAKRLSVPFYDERTIELMSLEEKTSPEKITKEDSFLQGTINDLYRENYSYSQEDMAINDSIFLMESKTIRNISKKGACVMEGKCADYVLGRSNVFSVFITAPEEYREQKLIDDGLEKEDKALHRIKKEDSRRANHYSRNTKGIWGDARYYDLCINRASFPKSTIVSMIMTAHIEKSKRL